MSRTDPPLEEYLYGILRRDGSLVPLGRLAGRVKEERGAYDAVPARLRACLDARPDRFLVVDPEPPLPGMDRWPEPLQERYAAALAAAAGPLVAALDPPTPGHRIRRRRARAAPPVPSAPPVSQVPRRALGQPLVDTLAQLQRTAAAPELARAARMAWALLAALGEDG